MKAFLYITLTLCLAFVRQMQAQGATYTPEQLDQLLGPIALYPDPLVAIILPASTAPSDIALAGNYLSGNGNSSGIEAQPWDPSVRALARYPEILKWMNDNLDWTQTVGAAFTQQPSDVMKSIQQLRAKAIASGSLVTTAQQALVRSGDDIRIVPVQIDTIYVPQYDATLVYESHRGYEGPYLTFGIGMPVGAWLSYQCDWDDYGIWVGPYYRGWEYRREWRRPVSISNPWRAWRPEARRSRELVRNAYRPDARLPSPRLPGGYHAPAHQPAPSINLAPHQVPSRPDYRGREVVVPQPNRTAPSSGLFGNYNRGTQTRDFSNHGQQSRTAPVRAMPSNKNPVPPRATAPATRPVQAPRPSAQPSSQGPRNEPAGQDQDKRERH